MSTKWKLCKAHVWFYHRSLEGKLKSMERGRHTYTWRVCDDRGGEKKYCERWKNEERKKKLAKPTNINIVNKSDMNKLRYNRPVQRKRANAILFISQMWYERKRPKKKSNKIYKRLDTDSYRNQLWLRYRYWSSLQIQYWQWHIHANKSYW